MPPPTDPTNYPLIRAILHHYPVPPHPTAWLSHPSILAAFEPTLSPTGDLLHLGTPKGSWTHCLKISGLNWITAHNDLIGLFESHENVDPPLVLGTSEDFMALVYMGSEGACQEAIQDLDGAVIGCDAPLGVGLVDVVDLERALEMQKGG